MAKSETTEVRLYFPNINKDFVYRYPFEWEHDRLQEAMQQWYEQESEKLFALYGYSPMNVSVRVDGELISDMNLCYQEYLYQCFFHEGGEPWHGRFGHFTTSLMEVRWSHEREELKTA